jgi:hypothetical protein
VFFLGEFRIWPDPLSCPPLMPNMRTVIPAIRPSIYPNVSRKHKWTLKCTTPRQFLRKMLLQPTFPSTAIEGSKNTILEPHVEGGGEGKGWSCGQALIHRPFVHSHQSCPSSAVGVGGC